MESKEVRRKTTVHAHESNEAKTGRSSQGLALEQFFILRQKGCGIAPHRCLGFDLGPQSTSKAPPFPQRRTGHPAMTISFGGTRSARKVACRNLDARSFYDLVIKHFGIV